MKKILLIEDDKGIAELERDYLEASEFAVEIVRDGSTGLAIPPRDAVAIADAVERLAKDEVLRTTMVENALRLVRENYDLEAVSERLVELFSTAGSTGRA